MKDSRFIVYALVYLLTICTSITHAFDVSPNFKFDRMSITNNRLNKQSINILHSNMKNISFSKQYKSKRNKWTRLFSSSSIAINEEQNHSKTLGPIRSAMTKVATITFILSLCISLPLVLLPIEILHKAKIIDTTKRERLSLRAGQFCSRWSLRFIPFAKVNVITKDDKSKNLERSNEEPEPSIWVCNHTSMLDVFFLLATDKKMRGHNKRPIKIIYWKQLEANPVTKILFKMCGFIPIQMEANKPGEDNKYDPKSFKNFLRAAKKAFTDGFDIGILPEGQLNPTPEAGLLPVFSGAFTLAKMSRRPIKLVAIHGAHKIWHATDGIIAKERTVSVRAYPSGRKFDSADDFTQTFQNVVGHFGATGKDVDHLDQWLDGTMKSVSKEKNDD